MKKHPVIITASHSCGDVPENIKERLSLSDFEIWQMHDPFTAETCIYPQAYATHKALNHRILGDLNRDRDAKDIFRENDFYGRKIWQETRGLEKEEKEDILKKFWDPYRNGIKKSFQELINKGVKKILFIDHHNTAIDHPANNGQYLPPINLGNYGDAHGNFIEKPLSASAEIICAFQSFLQKELSEITTEINKVYKGSALLRFVQNEIQPEFPDCEIHAVHLEYNLNLIFNPLSKNIDNKARNSLHNGINQAISLLMKDYFLS